MASGYEPDEIGLELFTLLAEGRRFESYPRYQAFRRAPVMEPFLWLRVMSPTRSGSNCSHFWPKVVGSNPSPATTSIMGEIDHWRA